MSRMSTGIPKLDEHLGGGLIPGGLTLVVGATGIGKSQLAVHFAHAGASQEGHPGFFFDMTYRGDSQAHRDYAARLCNWELETAELVRASPAGVFAKSEPLGNYLKVFDYRGRRPRSREKDFDTWHEWQAELSAKLDVTVNYFYRHFVRGARRVVIDGIEPVEDQRESIQYELLEYVYEQVLRKEAAWLARDVLRQDFRRYCDDVQRHAYETSDVGCLAACTSRHVMLEQLIEDPLGVGDVLAGANTIIYMGKTRRDDEIGRGLYIAKHRGSACSDRIIPFRIDEGGLVIE